MDLQILLAERALERLTVVIFGGISMYLGYALFMKGIVGEQVAQLEVMTWKVRLQKVGPGVFFALFGTAILISSLAKPLDIHPAPAGVPPDSNQHATAPQQATAVSYLGNGGGDLKLAHAINSVLRIRPDKTTASLADKGDFARAQQALRDTRDALIVRNLGDQTLIPLFKTRDGKISNAQNIEETQKLEKVIPWMDDTMAQEPDDGSSGQP